MHTFRNIVAVGYATATAAAIGFYFSVLSSMYTEFSLTGLFHLLLPALLLLATLVPAALSAFHLLRVQFENAHLCKWAWLCPLILLLLSAAAYLLAPITTQNAEASFFSFASTLIAVTVKYYWGYSFYLPVLFQLLALIALLPFGKKKEPVNA